jgi:hypothetical protein
VKSVVGYPLRILNKFRQEITTMLSGRELRLSNEINRNEVLECMEMGNPVLLVHTHSAQLLKDSWDYVSNMESGGSNPFPGSPQMVTYLLQSLSNNTKLADKQWKKLSDSSSNLTKGNYEDMAALSPLNVTRLRLVDTMLLKDYDYLWARFSIIFKSKLVYQGVTTSDVDFNANKLLKLQLAILALSPEPVINSQSHESYWRRDPRVRKYNELFPIMTTLTCGEGIAKRTLNVRL